MIALAINSFRVLKLNNAFLVHFQVMANKKIMIKTSVLTVPIATPMAGLSLKTNPILILILESINSHLYSQQIFNKP